MGTKQQQSILKGADAIALAPCREASEARDVAEVYCHALQCSGVAWSAAPEAFPLILEFMSHTRAHQTCSPNVGTAKLALDATVQTQKATQSSLSVSTA